HGSKGKGTVAALVGAGLEAAGFRVCVLSSPHVESVTERVRLRGLAPIGEEVLAKSIEAALNRAVPGATWFDVFVAASLHAARHCDWAVIECGLGGRRDSTNVLDAEVCALTSVELEHVEVLGPTVSRIAREKAAIASRRGVLVASAACPPAALRAAKDVAANRGAGFALAEPDPRPTPFLRSNLGLAKRILDHLGRRGLRCKRPPLRRVSGRLLDRPRPLRVARAALPARREWLAPDLLVDAAHTPAAVRSLASYVGGNRAAVALLGLADDKDLDGVAAAVVERLRPRAVVCVCLDDDGNSRTRAAALRRIFLANSLDVLGDPTPRVLDGAILAATLERARTIGAITLAFGSFRLCAQLARLAVSRGRRSRSVTNRVRTLRKEREVAAIKVQGQQRRVVAAQRAQEYAVMSRASTKIGRVSRGHAQRRKMSHHIERPLDDADVHDGLFALGRAAFDLRHAYLGLRVQRAKITEIDAIARYPRLQTVDLEKNVVRSLKPLERLPYLTRLNVADNALTEVLDVTFPTCRPGAAWSTGAAHAGSQLRFVDASRNKIAKIRDLSAHAHLRELKLDGNHIDRITGLSALPCLRALSLCSNQIAQLDGLDGLPLLELRLDDNKLRFLENLDTLKLLRRLTVSHNYIDTLDGLQLCAHLGALDVSYNNIDYVREVEFLADLPLFSELHLCGNKCADLDFYRRRVIVCLQRLTLLDASEISSEEKVEAINLHGAEDSDLPLRVATHEKHFGDSEPWADYLPPFVEPEPSPFCERRLAARLVGKLVHRVVTQARADVVSTGQQQPLQQQTCG
ncbi:hypothetical protein CTAYLR_009653, partial [Chrysophaeum taylorii]